MASVTCANAAAGLFFEFLVLLFDDDSAAISDLMMRSARGRPMPLEMKNAIKAALVVPMSMNIAPCRYYYFNNIPEKFRKQNLFSCL